MLQKSFVQSFEVKDVDPKTGTFIQAFTRFNVLDSDNERGRKGMFSKTWQDNFHRIKHLFNHNSSQPLGESQKFWEDDEYAYAQSKIGSHNLGQDFIKMVESGLIKEASYGYQVIKSNKLKDGSTELLEVKQWEWSSLSGWGANQFTPVISLQKSMESNGIKSLLEEYANKKSFVKNTTATDDCILLVKNEIIQIENFLSELFHKASTEAVPAEATLQPQQMDIDVFDTDMILSYLHLQTFNTN